MAKYKEKKDKSQVVVESLWIVKLNPIRHIRENSFTSLSLILLLARTN
jgi:hypothetical protein